MHSIPNFADRLIQAVQKKQNPCCIGLDPRIDLMPDFIKSGRDARRIVADFHELVLDAVADLVPVVKPQLAFYEQYGLPGMEAYVDTCRMARERGLLIIADGKRNDISSTAEAYATAFLGEDAFDADSMTVTPYLGRDSLAPFVDACAQHGKGLFVVLKTSNPGSKDFQDQPLASTSRPLYETIASIINDLGKNMIGQSGYSSIGAVVGATYPEDAARLRTLMPHAIILVPGYGAQGGTAETAAASFNDDSLGAIVSSSRGITYGFQDPKISRIAFGETVRNATLRMIEEINGALRATSTPTPAR